MKSLFLILYIISIIVLLHKSIQMLIHKQGFELMLGLCLTFAIVPDFMMFDYLGLHISYAFVFLFAYGIPIVSLFVMHKGVLIINRDDRLVWIFLLILLLYALLTPLFFINVSDYYTNKLGSYLYSVLLYLFIIGAFREELVNKFEDYCDVILIAIMAYVFKNYYIAGIVNFRIVYETSLMEFKNVIFASRILGIGIIICVYKFLKSNKSLYIVILLAMIAQMIMFESRGPLLSLVVAALLVWIIVRIKTKGIQMHFSINFKRIVVVIALVVAVYYLVSNLYNNGFLDRLIYKYNYLRMGRSEDRNVLYSMCFEIIMNSLPFGVGFGNTYDALSAAGSSVLYNYPHNVVLEVFMEDGIILGLLFVCIIISYVLRTFRGNNSRKKNLFVALTVFSITNAMFSGDIVGNVWIFIFGSLLSYVSLYEDKIFQE